MVCQPVVKLGHAPAAGHTGGTVRGGHGGRKKPRRRRRDQNVPLPGRSQPPRSGHAGRSHGRRPHLARAGAAAPRAPHRLPHRHALHRRTGPSHDRLRRVRGVGRRPAVDPSRPGPPLRAGGRVPRNGAHHAARLPAPRHRGGHRPLPLRPAAPAPPRRGAARRTDGGARAVAARVRGRDHAPAEPAHGRAAAHALRVPAAPRPPRGRFREGGASGAGGGAGGQHLRPLPGRGRAGLRHQPQRQRLRRRARLLPPHPGARGARRHR